MGRPPLRLGTHGNIRAYRTGNTWRAETYFRDVDGETRLVKRSGRTKAKAVDNLKEACRDREHRADAEFNRWSSFEQAGELWLAEVKLRQRGTTFDRYKCRLHGRLIPALGKLRLHEVTTGVCDRFLRSLTAPVADGGAGLSPPTARGYRSTLSAIMRYAVRMDAIARNPVTECAEIRGGGKRSRALTAEERVELLEKLDADKVAVEGDLPTLLRYLLGSGVRIGEALALRWCRLDLDGGTVVHGETLARETGKGLVLHPPKTKSGYRILVLPGFVVDMLRVRYPGEDHDQAPVFPNGFGDWRDPINTARAIRGFRDRAGFPWFTSHSCRHTMITICDQAGVRPREISGHSGHTDPGFTSRFYMDLRQQSGAVARALDEAYRPHA